MGNDKVIAHLFVWYAAGEVFVLAAAEVIPGQSGVEGLNGADRGLSGGTASRPVRRMVVQSNS